MYFALYSDEHGVRVWIFIADPILVDLRSVGQPVVVIRLKHEPGLEQKNKKISQIFLGTGNLERTHWWQN